MTAQVLLMTQYRPEPLDIDAMPQVLLDARAVLRSPFDYADQDIRAACEVMQAFGDTNDWIEADGMLIAMASIDRRVARLTPVSKWPHEIGPVLFFCAAAYFALLFFMAVTP